MPTDKLPTGSAHQPAVVEQPTGITLIAQERARQVTVEGWTPEHDNEHSHGEMAIAAACYAVEGTDAEVRYPYFDDGEANDRGWPWEPAADKRKTHNRPRQLAIAGALIAAELDRILQPTESAQSVTPPQGGHEKPNWLWCERCVAWIETQHVCGAQYIDRGTHFELVREAAPEPQVTEHHLAQAGIAIARSMNDPLGSYDQWLVVNVAQAIADASQGEREAGREGDWAEGLAVKIVEYLAGKHIDPDGADMEVLPIAAIIRDAAPSLPSAMQPEYEAKLLGFGEADRIRLCRPCVERAIGDDLVIFSSGIPIEHRSVAPPLSLALQAELDEIEAQLLLQVCTPLQRDRISRLLTLARERGDGKCTWTIDSDEFGERWIPSCGGDPWEFETGGPQENKVKFCFHCGKKLAPLPPVQPKEGKER